MYITAIFGLFSGMPPMKYLQLFLIPQNFMRLTGFSKKKMHKIIYFMAHSSKTKKDRPFL